MQDYNIRVNNF